MHRCHPGCYPIKVSFLLILTNLSLSPVHQLLVNEHISKFLDDRSICAFSMSDQALKLELSETVARLKLINKIFDPNSGNCNRHGPNRYGKGEIVINAREFAKLIHNNLGSVVFSFSRSEIGVRLTRITLSAYLGGVMKNTPDIVPAIGNKMSRKDLFYNAS